MKKAIILFLPVLLLSKNGNAQLTPLDVEYKFSIPGDSILLVIDSMIVTKYQVYLGKFRSLRGGASRPSNMKAYIKGYELADSINISAIKDKIEIQISDPSYTADTWYLAILKPGNRRRSFISDFIKKNYFADKAKLDLIEPGDIIVISCVTAYSKAANKLYDLEASVYKISN